MLDFSDIKQGSTVTISNQPFTIVKCDFMRMQQRKPTKKCILRNLITGNSINHTFNSGDRTEEADIRREQATFMYQIGVEISFMLTKSFETIEIPADLLGDKIGYLKEGLDVQVLYYADKPINVELPIKIAFKVTSTPEVSKGNTVSDVTKEAIIETGKIIRVPAFIKPGETILVNTVEDEYAERVNG